MFLRVLADRSVLLSLWAAFFYAFVSVSVTFFNKDILSIWKFEYSNFLLLVQHIFTVACLHFMKTVGLIEYPPFELSKCKQLFPVAFLYSLNVGIALNALMLLNVPMYGILKRFNIILVLVGEKVFLNKTASSRVKQAAVMIVIGIVLAGLGDFDFDLFGYLLAGLSCLSQAGYLLYVAKVGISGVDSHGMLFYNSVLSIPMVLAIVVLTGELWAVPHFPHLYDRTFQFILFMNLLLGSLLNYSMFLCTNVNSALTTVIMGQLKSSASIIIGLFTFGGVKVVPVNFVGLVLNTFGGFWYSWVKYQEKEASIRSRKGDSHGHGHAHTDSDATKIELGDAAKPSPQLSRTEADTAEVLEHHPPPADGLHPEHRAERMV